MRRVTPPQTPMPRGCRASSSILGPPGRQSASTRAALKATSPASTTATVAANASTEAEYSVDLLAFFVAGAAATATFRSSRVRNVAAWLYSPTQDLGLACLRLRPLRRGPSARWDEHRARVRARQTEHSLRGTGTRRCAHGQSVAHRCRLAWLVGSPRPGSY